MKSKPITPKLKAFLISIGTVSIEFALIPRAQGPPRVQGQAPVQFF